VLRVEGREYHLQWLGMYITGSFLSGKFSAPEKYNEEEDTCHMRRRTYVWQVLRS
jgi:hypothetical protein